MQVMALPGWATTERVFQGLALPEDTYYVPNTTPEALETAKQILLKATQPVKLIGFSMGAMVIAQWAQDTTLTPFIESAHLIAPFPHYPQVQIAYLNTGLMTNKNHCLDGFYREGFGHDRITADQISLTQAWQQALTVAQLRRSLSALGEINLTQYDGAKNPIPITITHGTQDKIAPISIVKRCFKSWHNTTLKPVENGGHFLIQEGAVDAKI